MFTSYRQKLASFKRFSGIQRNFEIGFRCLVLLEKISFDKIFEAVPQKLAIRVYGQAYMSYKGAIAFCFSLSVHPSFAAKENFSNKNSSRLFLVCGENPAHQRDWERSYICRFQAFICIQSKMANQYRAALRAAIFELLFPKCVKRFFLECRQVVCANLRSQQGLSKEI